MRITGCSAGGYRSRSSANSSAELPVAEDLDEVVHCHQAVDHVADGRTQTLVRRLHVREQCVAPDLGHLDGPQHRAEGGLLRQVTSLCQKFSVPLCCSLCLSTAISGIPPPGPG